MSGLTVFFEKYTARLIFAVYAIAYLIPISTRNLWIPDEARYAEISREMIVRGDWIVPRLLGLDYFEKPVAGYWLNNISQLLFGETHFAVRFASALCAGLTGWLIYWFTERLFHSQKKAFAAATIYLSFLLVYAIGTYSVLDTMVTLWLNLTLVAFYCSLCADTSRKKIIGYALVGFAAGLGFLTKGFISLAVPVIVALPYLIYKKQFSELRYLWAAILSFTIVSLPWALAVHAKAPDYWHYFFWVEHIQRFTADDAQHREAIWFYIPVILAGSLPWLGLLFPAIKESLKNYAARQKIIFLLCWLIIPFIFLSIAKGKLPTYILICFAPLAILLSHGISELVALKQWRYIRVNNVINIFYGLSLALVVGLLGSGIVGKAPLYDATESLRLIFAIIMFAFWALCGILCFYYPKKTLFFTALAPLAFGLLLGNALPNSASYAKQPENFIHEHFGKLSHSKFILSSDPGIAVSLAWELKRDDIRLYSSDGEFAYGLKTITQIDKLIGAGNFSEWLALARTEGDVALVTRQSNVADVFPTADETTTQQGLTLLFYSAHTSNP